MELNVLNLKKYLTALEKHTTYNATDFGGDKLTSNHHGEDMPHPECMMTSSVENLTMLSSQIRRQKRKYRRHNSYESESLADSDSMASSTSETSDSDSLSRAAEDDFDATEWPSGEEAEDVPLEYGLIDSEVIELGCDKLVWETHFIALDRKPGIGFGIAVSGGVDNPHFASGETSICVSDVLKGGPAEGKLKVKDRVLSINGEDLEDVFHSTAIQLLQSSPDKVELIVRRRIYLPSPHSRLHKSVVISKPQAKKELGFELGCKFYIKKANKDQMLSTSTTSLALPEEQIEEGDFILKINDKETDSLTLPQVQKLLEKTKGKLQLTLERPPQPITASRPASTTYGSTTSLYLNAQAISGSSTSSPPESELRMKTGGRPRASTCTSDIITTRSTVRVEGVRRSKSSVHCSRTGRSRANTATDGALSKKQSTSTLTEGRVRASTFSGDISTQKIEIPEGEEKTNSTECESSQAQLSLSNLNSSSKNSASSRSLLTVTDERHVQSRRYHKKPGRAASFSNQSCQSSPGYLHRRMRKEKAERTRKHSTSLQYINRGFMNDEPVRTSNANGCAKGRTTPLPLWTLTQY